MRNADPDLVAALDQVQRRVRLELFAMKVEPDGEVLLARLVAPESGRDADDQRALAGPGQVDVPRVPVVGVLQLVGVRLDLVDEGSPRRAALIAREAFGVAVTTVGGAVGRGRLHVDLSRPLGVAAHQGRSGYK